MKMFYMSILILVVVYLLILLSFFISMKNKNDWEKMSPFECGFNLMSFPRNPFSLRFFLISIIFLIFDIEIIILIPFVLNIFNMNSIIWMIMMFLFLTVLIWGLFHEWFLGSLNWL
uniref:NADH-ubiquinone oxidoreductase chain 3 n=1 Tax=Psephenothrips eriobotryae TaxID=2913602 RepID=A0A9E6YCY9_9NEOP|nr:NADH dehydrogenase subunit 3 [Psephenothrips eriobotryae]UJY97333.1 NADH dehydrogenase subunit 3 [Psephenothrips eriobotryae]